MGWLFAVSQGMQQGSRQAVLRSLLPIALGHELSIALVAAGVLGAATVVDPAALHIGAAGGVPGVGGLRFVKRRGRWRWATVRGTPPRLSLGAVSTSTA